MKTKNIIMIIMLISFLPVAGMTMQQLHQTKQVEKKHDVYYCPMHPNVFYDHPGNCPICGMKLIKKEGNTVAQKPPCGCCGMRHS